MRRHSVMGSAIAITLLLMAGCNSIPSSSMSSVEVSQDPITGDTKLVGRSFSEGNQTQTRQVNHRLEAAVREQGSPLIQVVVTYWHAQKRAEWASAVSNDGTELELEVLSSEFIRPTGSDRDEWMETYVVFIPEDYLRRNASTGFSFNLRGSGDRQRLSISSAYVTAFLAKLDSYL